MNDYNLLFTTNFGTMCNESYTIIAEKCTRKANTPCQYPFCLSALWHGVLYLQTYADGGHTPDRQSRSAQDHKQPAGWAAFYSKSSKEKPGERQRRGTQLNGTGRRLILLYICIWRGNVHHNNPATVATIVKSCGDITTGGRLKITHFLTGF